MHCAHDTWIRSVEMRNLRPIARSDSDEVAGDVVVAVDQP